MANPLDGEITEATLTELRSQPDEIAAVALDGRLRTIDRQERRGFMEKGLIVYEVERRLLWRFLADYDGTPYTSLTQWIVKAAPFGYSTCMGAKETVKKLVTDIPAEQLEDIPRCNAIHLIKLSTAVRKSSAILDGARTKTEKEFIKQIQETHPDQHYPDAHRIYLNPDEDEFAAITQALKLAAIQGKRREEIVAEWAMEYLHQNQEAEIA